MSGPQGQGAGPGGLPPPKAPKTPRPPKPDRRLSREFAVQGLYEWLVARHDLGVIDAHLREDGEFSRAAVRGERCLLYTSPSPRD